MQHEWDTGKAAENLRKHGVDFTDAIAALEDPNRAEEIDDRFVHGEERIQVIGDGSWQGLARGCDAPQREYMQNHIGPEGHTT